MERLTKRSGNGTAIYNTPSGDPVKWENNRHEVLQKLAEYEDLEEQGRLLKLPYAVGDTVYYRYDGIKIAPMRVEQIIIAQYGINLLLEYCGNNEKLKCWRINIESSAFDCKIISLTREEAEAALSKADK